MNQLTLEFPKVANSIDLPIGTTLNSIDLPIGTTFNIGKVQYQVVLLREENFANPCEGCMIPVEYCHYIQCNSTGRVDYNEVIFTITNLENQL